MVDTESLVEKLGLQPHPEGGFFAESYRSADTTTGLPGRFSGERNFATAIYFLLRAGEKNRLHRIKSDETWHFYLGQPMLIHMIKPGGSYNQVRLGPNLATGEQLQYTVPHGDWFASEVTTGFALVGCTVSPGFDFADFELAEPSELLSEYPHHGELIKKLT